MATIENGITGGFSGKVGNIIGYQLNGRWVIKALPKPNKQNRIGTAEQKACRSAFSKMQFFLNPLVDFVRVGFNLERKKRMMTAHNVAKSYNMLHAQDANGDIVYDKVLLTYGSLLSAENPKVDRVDEGLIFSWDYINTLNYNRQHDQVMIVAYSLENKKAFKILSGAKRMTKSQILEIDKKEIGNELHMWISFIADDRESIAMSTYVGSIVY